MTPFTSYLENPRELAEVWDALTEAEILPWYRENVEEDRARVNEMDALRNGFEPETPSDQPATLGRA